MSQYDTFTSSTLVIISLWVACAYLIGSVPFAVVVSKLLGLQDPRSYGSGNPGATNVLRSGNKSAAMLTLVGDAAKGWFAVWLSQKLFPSPLVLALTAIAVFLGHLYPVFLKFKGGKGVATALGVIMAVQPLVALICLLVWIMTAVIFRMSSLAALVSAVCAPVLFEMGGYFGYWDAHASIWTALLFISLMLFYRHSANISRILKGTESRIGSKK